MKEKSTCMCVYVVFFFCLVPQNRFALLNTLTLGQTLPSNRQSGTESLHLMCFAKSPQMLDGNFFLGVGKNQQINEEEDEEERMKGIRKENYSQE